MSAHDALLLTIVVAAVLVVLGIAHRWDLFTYNLVRWSTFAGTGYATFWFLLNVRHVSQGGALFLGFAVGACCSEFFVAPPPGRRIPKAERRRAIARFEAKTRQKYDPQKHDIDHVVPYSKGGNSRGRNLRVIDRGENRSKRDRSAWWDLFG